MLVVDGRGGASHGSPRRWLWGGESVVLISVSDAGCGGGEAEVLMVPDAACLVGYRRSHGSPRCWLLSGEAGVLMADPDTDCWGWKGLTLIAIPDTGYGGERRGFSWQSQTLVVGVGDRRGFSWQFPGAGPGECGGSLKCWLWGGELGVFMAVPYVGCSGREVLVLMAVPIAFCCWRSQGSPINWLWGVENWRFTWQS